jgi:hypothetical protein
VFFPIGGGRYAVASEAYAPAPSLGEKQRGAVSFVSIFCLHHIFLLFGGFGMKTYYQVFSSFKLSHGKPSLVSVSLHSTSEYLPFLVGNYYSLSNSRFFHTVEEANHYISYLFSRYPKCGLLRPLLDAKQLLLF